MPLRCPSSSPQNPLRWAFVGAPIGCAEKRKRFLMVSREKGLAAAFRASPGTLAAPCTGVLARCWTMALPTQPHMSMKKAGGISGYPQLLFCCRNLVGIERTVPGSLRMPGCGSKTGAGCIRDYPQLTGPPYAGEWTKLSNQHPKTPRNRREKAFQAEPEMPPPEPFSLTPSKGAFSFSSPGKREWGF